MRTGLEEADYDWCIVIQYGNPRSIQSWDCPDESTARSEFADAVERQKRGDYPNVSRISLQRQPRLAWEEVEYFDGQLTT